MNFQREPWLLLLLALPVLLPVFLRGQRMGEKMRAVLFRRARVTRPIWPTTVALALGLLGLILALARPGWNPRQEPLVRETRDVVFVLDVSRSMLARDRVPNRLENAKATIISCLDELGEEQRVGLVAFAGTTSIKCPLTTDHNFFRKALEEAGSGSVSHGGTLIGDALLKTVEKLLTEEMRGFQDVILLTDGGDQAGNVEKAVAALNEKEASLIAIGLGNDQSGTRIPAAAEGEAGYLLHEGREVWSRLETETLQELVGESKRGLMLSAGTRAIDLAEIYRQFSMHTEKKAVMVDVVERYEEGFPWMLGLSFACLLVATRPLLFMRVLPFLAVCLVCESGSPVQASPYNEANTLYRTGDYYGAMNAYLDVATETSRRDLKRRCFYNMGNCAFALAEQPPEEEYEDEEEAEMFDPTVYYYEAVRYYRAALDLAADDAQAAHNLELARFRIQQAESGENADDDQSQQSNQSSESEEGEGKPSDEGDEGEGEEGDMEEADADASDAGDMERATSNMTDMQRQDVPPPSLTPQDLLSEEMMNNAQREKSGKKSKPVERDW